MASTASSSSNGCSAKSPPSGDTLSMNGELDRLAVWISPLTTVYYFVLECIYQLTQLWCFVIRTRKQFIALCLFLTILLCLNYFPGMHSKTFASIKSTSLWWGWWVWLGFLSSCGFGTGLHTFVLYLGPFIASVTMSAYECNSLKFPSPPYPDDIICPDESITEKVNFWKIVRKVDVEAILWGIGTAMGELPPYFMAQGARLSGERLAELDALDDLDLEDLSSASQQPDGQRQRSLSTSNLTLHKRGELLLHRLVTRAGFLGILLCASIPNPLFDLAGMTCGHFLVPFWSFFGATCIGKAFIKVHLQMFMIIAISSEHHVEWLVDLLGNIPFLGSYIQTPAQNFLQSQKAKLHSKHASSAPLGWTQTLLSYLITCLIATFIVSIVNTMAKSYFRRKMTNERLLDKQRQ